MRDLTDGRFAVGEVERVVLKLPSVFGSRRTKSVGKAKTQVGREGVSSDWLESVRASRRRNPLNSIFRVDPVTDMYALEQIQSTANHFLTSCRTLHRPCSHRTANGRRFSIRHSASRSCAATSPCMDLAYLPSRQRGLELIQRLGCRPAGIPPATVR